MKRFLSFISPTSLRGQLLLWLLGPLVAIGLLVIYDGYRAARDTADSVSDRVLSGSALAIAERVFVNDNNALEVDIPYVALQMLTSSEDDRVFYRIENYKGEFITGYRGLTLPPISSTPSEITFHDGLFRGTPVRIASYSGAASSSTKSFGFRVAVAETTNGRVAIAKSILLRSLLRQSTMLFGAAILVWLAVSRALQPLRKVEQAIGRRSAEDVRPIDHPVPTEVSGLVRTINELVSRFASSITALQNFTSNTSHQFRTPLALIKTHLDIASRETDKELQQEAISSAHSAVNDAERLMAQLLLLARINATSKNEIRTHICDLTLVTRHVCEEFILRISNSSQSPFGLSNVDLGFEGSEPVLVNADETLVQEVVRNLIDNAIKHGGDGVKIDVAVTKNEATGEISIRDSGQGFDPKVILRDTTVPTDLTKKRPHTGIGLSIVTEIVDLLDGELTAIRLPQPSGMAVHVAFKIRYTQQ